ncbi:MAG: hypothetical protein HYZ17_14095 [Betaproteobacteria bacterium]|nr:hypothetical protein [Betaproteobacteria bacterium]
MRINRWPIGVVLSIATSTVAIAYEQWDTAMKTGESPTGDPMLTKCHYQTTMGYKFSIMVRGTCPYIVKINPETGKVKPQ